MTRVAGATLLARQLVAQLRPETAGELELVTRTAGGVAMSALSAAALLEIERTLPLLIRTDPGRGRIAIGSEPVRGALQAALAHYGSRPREQSVSSRIRTALAAGQTDAALADMAANGGPFFALIHGVDAAQRVLHAFPESARNGSEMLTLADAINAMKSGDASHARQVFDRLHPGLAGTLEPLTRTQGDISDALFCCRLVVAVGEERMLDDALLAALFRRLEALPDDAWMVRGMLLNVALDGFVRRGQWAMAEETAMRARVQFAQAQANLATFYIDLYRGLIALMCGDLVRMAERLDDAADALDRVGIATVNDRRLLDALRHIRVYETGDPRPLAEFLLAGMEEEGFSEVWPSIAGPIIEYGARALGQVVTLAAGRAFVERWRLHQWQSQRFTTSIALADIELLQFHDRWHGADEGLADLDAARLAPEALATTRDRDLIRIAIRACRQQIESAPAAPAAMIAALLGNDRLVPRQRIALLVWQAAGAADAADWEALRPMMRKLAGTVSATGLTALLVEQRQVLARIFGHREARRRMAAVPAIASFMRDHRALTEQSAAGSEPHGLTRQELRVLFLLAERTPNKLMARRLGLALPTVRFHLKNVYAKLGGTDRKAAIEEAVRRGILTPS